MEDHSIQIIKKVFEKAISNGYDTSWCQNGVWRKDEQYGEVWMHDEGLMTELLSHDFAKAFWKNETKEPEFADLHDWLLYDEEVPTFCGELWQYHLQRLAIAEDRIAYLAQFLDV